MNPFLLYFSILFQIIAIKSNSLGAPISDTKESTKKAFSQTQHILKREKHDFDLINLRPDSCPFTTDVNIFGQNSSLINHVPMSISLYTSRSFLVSPSSEGCDNFVPYDCSHQAGCNQSEVYETFEYPFFQLEGNLTTANISFNDKLTESSETELLYVHTCRKNWSQLAPPQKVSGSIGFGVDPNKPKFLKTESFSIYTYPEGQQADLIFGFDPSKIANYSNIRLFYSNKNWEIPVQAEVTLSTNADEESQSEETTFDGNIIFDINSCYLSFPLDLFKFVLKQLAQYNLTCTNLNNDQTLPYTCTYLGDPKALPDVVISDLSIANEIRIEPYIYLGNRKNNTFDFMIIPSVQRIQEEYASSLKYSTYIILGLPFLKEHYIYFSSEGMNRVVIYHSQHPNHNFGLESLKDSDSNNSYIGLIIVGVLAGLTIGALVYSCIAHQCNKRKITEPIGLEIAEEEDQLKDRLILDVNQRQSTGRVIKLSRFAQIAKEEDTTSNGDQF